VVLVSVAFVLCCSDLRRPHAPNNAPHAAPLQAPANNANNHHSLQRTVSQRAAGVIPVEAALKPYFHPVITSAAARQMLQFQARGSFIIAIRDPDASELRLSFVHPLSGEVSHAVIFYDSAHQLFVVPSGQKPRAYRSLAKLIRESGLSIPDPHETEPAAKQDFRKSRAFYDIVPPIDEAVEDSAPGAGKATAAAAGRSQYVQYAAQLVSVEARGESPYDIVDDDAFD
jgi:hypothetical protein